LAAVIELDAARVFAALRLGSDQFLLDGRPALPDPEPHPAASRHKIAIEIAP